MNLKPRSHEEPEINVVSLIDVVLLLVVFFILSSMNSIAASSSIGCSSLRKIQILASRSGSISRSSRRVPERLMSIAG